MGCGASKKATRSIDEELKVGVRDDDTSAILEALARKGVTIDDTDEHGMTPLMHAAVLGNERAAYVLIGKGADLDKRDHNNMTAAMHAAYVGKDATKQSKEAIEAYDDGSQVRSEAGSMSSATSAASARACSVLVSECCRSSVSEARA